MTFLVSGVFEDPGNDNSLQPVNLCQMVEQSSAIIVREQCTSLSHSLVQIVLGREVGGHA